ncbi:MAG: hypothetical protein KKF12_12245 [Proteobacteria bacterium]|nr:hypothetical protein [Desulfobacula sp.]MBU3951015.1 hypothetical protein [Pseudomonadota bacterium]MBU4131583.1 hypothetical protein [Pseudomonadota bacterium]
MKTIIDFVEDNQMLLEAIEEAIDLKVTTWEDLFEEDREWIIFIQYNWIPDLTTKALLFMTPEQRQRVSEFEGWVLVLGNFDD